MVREAEAEMMMATPREAETSFRRGAVQPSTPSVDSPVINKDGSHIRRFETGESY